MKVEKSAMSYRQPKRCRERPEILTSVKATIDHIIVLHHLEIAAVSEGDMEEWEAIGHNLRKATEFKDSLVELICSPGRARPATLRMR